MYTPSYTAPTTCSFEVVSQSRARRQWLPTKCLINRYTKAPCFPAEYSWPSRRHLHCSKERVRTRVVKQNRYSVFSGAVRHEIGRVSRHARSSVTHAAHNERPKLALGPILSDICGPPSVRGPKESIAAPICFKTRSHCQTSPINEYHASPKPAVGDSLKINVKTK